MFGRATITLGAHILVFYDLMPLFSFHQLKIAVFPVGIFRKSRRFPLFPGAVDTLHQHGGGSA